MQNAWQAWTFVVFGQKKSGQDGRAGGGGWGDATDCGFWRNSGVRFSARPLEVVKPGQARTFAVAELAPSMTLKSYWVQKP